MPKNMSEYDVIIIGGNIIGATMAIILVKAGLSVALLEKNPITINKKHDEKHNEKHDKKHSLKQASKLFALAKNTCDILKNYNIADQISKYSQTIEHIRIVDDNSTSKIDFLPHHINIDNFGYMINEDDLRNLIYKDLIALVKDENYNKKITILDKYDDVLEFPEVDLVEKKERISLYRKNHIYVSVNNDSKNKKKIKLSASLIIAADGKYSRMRQLAKIKTIEHDYKQIAIVCDINHSWNHNGVAIEKFMSRGPFAILPKINGHSSSLVWTEKNDVKTAIEKSSNDFILDLINTRMDGYLGDITLASKVSVFPLKLINSNKYISCKHRLALIGDAAHSIHPVAGQGANLGFSDVELLCKLVIRNCKYGLDIGNDNLLEEYNRGRTKYANLMIGFTSGINALFSNDIMFVKLMRRSGMKIVDSVPALKNFFMTYASGIK